MTACLHLFSLGRNEKGLEGLAASLVYWRLYGTKETVKAGFCSAFFMQREQKKGNFVSPIFCREDTKNTESLWQVVETHGHTDVAGKADVNAEVDQSLFARA